MNNAVKTKVGKSRRSTHSIMNHEGYGELIIHKAGNTITIPNEFINESGALKKTVQACIQNLNPKNIEVLITKGVKVVKESQDMVG